MQPQFRRALSRTTSALAVVVAAGLLPVPPAAAQSVFVPEPVETRTIVREPLALTPAQRTTIYRTIVPQGRGKKPIVRERVVTETMGSGGPARERVIVDPPIRDRVVVEPPRDRVVIDQWGRERIVGGTTEVDYVVGDRVPGSVRLATFPERVIETVPEMRGYRYMVINDRLLLVDPVTSTVVEEIER